ncbi:MAG: substrate-binding domain-containing protein [Victivallales bacterium]
MFSKVELLKEKILDDIKSGRIRKSGAIPSRFSLMNRYSFSRGTVDKAVMELARDGFLHSRQGSGTFVADKRENSAIGQVYLAGDYGLRTGADAETADLASKIQQHMPCYLYNINDIKTSLGKIARPGTAVIWQRPSYEQLMTMKYLASAGASQLLIGRTYGNFDYVTTDACDGIRNGIRWLVGKGCRRIAFVTPGNNPDSPYIAERQIAFYEIAIELGIKLDIDMIFKKDFKDFKGDLDCISARLFKSGKIPDAIFSTYVSMAYPLMTIADGLGLETGRDFRFLTFDYEPKLEGWKGVGMLKQLWDEMGEKAVEWLLRKGRNGKSAFKIKISPKLLKGD